MSAQQRETAAQRRLRENKGVKASVNPFKAQDAKAKASNPNASFKLPKAGCVTSTSQVDAASSNIDKLLKWIQKRINQYKAVNVQNFTTSWEDGMALCALINYLLGDEALNTEDISADPDDRIKNLELAIKVATENGVPALIEASEVGKDRRSMVTYLHMVYTKLYSDKKDEKKEDNSDACHQ